MVLGRSFLFRKVAIIGVGLIGGSLGQALKKHKLAKEVLGVSRRKETLVQAVKMNAIDHGSHDIKRAVVNADLVVLATPVSIVNAMFETIAPHIKKNCIITDVGSTKVSIVADAQKTLPNPAMFVGSHPVAGSEKKGVEYSNPELFAKMNCIMTPTSDTHRHAVDRVKKMWSTMGAQVKIMSPEEHDQILAYVSHLPHLVAYALMSTIPDERLPFGAQGLKDTTRIAASNPEVWRDICFANARNIINAIDECAENLGRLRKAITDKDEKILMNELKNAKKKRDKLG